MTHKFDVIFLENALDFIDSLDIKTRQKVIYNIDKARFINDPKLFKKLTDEIWEFRTKYGSLQYRLFAFWDKTKKTETLVITTHGIVKKVDKIPKKEIDKALKIRDRYFEL